MKTHNDMEAPLIYHDYTHDLSQKRIDTLLITISVWTLMSHGWVARLMFNALEAALNVRIGVVWGQIYANLGYVISSSSYHFFRMHAYLTPRSPGFAVTDLPRIGRNRFDHGVTAIWPLSSKGRNYNSRWGQFSGCLRVLTFSNDCYISSWQPGSVA